MTVYRWGTYARVSSEEQAGPDSASLETQEREANAIVAREGGELIRRYVDARRYRVNGRLVQPSGERADRPEWQQLLADLKAGLINAVAAYHSGRLYRDYRPFIDFLEIVRSHGVHVVLAREMWSQDFAGIQVWRDNQENKIRVDRINMGRRKAARLGLPATRAPLFYATVRDETGRRTGYVLRDEYRPWLNELARLFLARIGYNQLARMLDLNPVTGKRLSNQSVREIINNKFMRGLIAYGEQARSDEPFTVPGRHAAAWDAETCAAIEHELDRRAALGRRVPHSDTALLSGVLRCGYCGRVLTNSTGTKNGLQFTSYYCYAVYNRQVDHPTNHVGEIRALKLIEAMRDADLPSDELAAHNLSQIPTSVQRDNGQRRRLSEQIAELAAALAATPASSSTTRAILGRELEAAQKALAKAELIQAPRNELPTLTLADASDAVAELRQGGALRQWDRVKLRAVIRRAFPVLYIANRQIVKPPSL